MTVRLSDYNYNLLVSDDYNYQSKRYEENKKKINEYEGWFNMLFNIMNESSSQDKVYKKYSKLINKGVNNIRLIIENTLGIRLVLNKVISMLVLFLNLKGLMLQQEIRYIRKMSYID